MNRLKFISPLTVCLVFVASVLAHDTWLIADHTSVAPNATVTLDLTSGMAFPALEFAPKRERVGNLSCRLAGRSFEISDVSEGSKSLQFKAKFAEPGVATIWITVPARTIELRPDEVKEYLDEVSAPDALRKQWGKKTAPKRWRESYSKHSKMFVRVGEPQSDQSWKEPVGMTLEIVPENDPTVLQAGDEFAVHVLKEGRPFPHFALNAVHEGETRGETRNTDATGRVTFRMIKASRWLLRGTDIRKSDRPDIDYESDFVTLTLEVSQKE